MSVLHNGSEQSESARRHWLCMGIHLKAGAGNDVSPIRAAEFKGRAMKSYLAWCAARGTAANPDVNEDNLTELLRADEISGCDHGVPEWKSRRETRKDGKP